jgi:dihydroxy-acid dehydratase
MQASSITAESKFKAVIIIERVKNATIAPLALCKNFNEIEVALITSTSPLPTQAQNGLQVGVSSVWYEGNPCNMHLMDLAAEVKAGVQDAGMVAFRFNTIGVSDGISMGTEGMSYSLQSRDLIADSIETVMGGQWYDGNISLPGCDKNMPGVLIAMGRLNRPSIMVYGGSIKPGYSKDNEPLDIVSAFQSYGKSHSCLCTA